MTQVIGGSLFGRRIFTRRPTRWRPAGRPVRRHATSLQKASLAYLAVILLVISLVTNLSRS